MTAQSNIITRSPTPTIPPATTTPPTTAPTTNPTPEDKLFVKENEVTTPEAQPHIKNSDGTKTLPGGGEVTAQGGTVIALPPGTVIGKDESIRFPKGGGASVTHSNGHTFNIHENAVIHVDENSPLGYWVEIDNPFADIGGDEWFVDYVLFAYSHGLMNGTDLDLMLFSPNAAATRGMIVTILYCMAGSPDAGGLANPFSDIDGDKYYADAVIWAAANGIVGGYGGGLYGPEDNITREQLAVILNNYIKSQGLDLPEKREYTDFSDDADIANYAKDAIERFFKATIINGKGDGIFDPKGDATRAEVAVMFKGLLEMIFREKK